MGQFNSATCGVSLSSVGWSVHCLDGFFIHMSDISGLLGFSFSPQGVSTSNTSPHG